MMQRKFAILTVVMLTLAMVVAGCTAMTAQPVAQVGAKNSLRVASWVAESHPMNTWVPKFVEDLAASSSNSMEVNYFPNGQLYQSSNIIPALIDGQVDIGIVGGGMLPAIVKDFLVIPSTINVLDFDQLFKAWDSPGGLLDILGPKMEQKNLKILAFASLGPYGTVSHQPITRPADLKGLKMRTTGAELERIVRSLGGSPVTIDPQEQYQAAQQGQIDAAQGGISGLYSSSLHEVFDHLLAPEGFGHGVVLWVMNLTKWNSLSAEQQTAVWESAKEAEVVFRKNSRDSWAGSIKKFKEAGLTVTVLKPTDVSLWAEWTSAFGPAEEMTKKEVDPAILKVIETYSGQ